jgi:hypothetical protein
MDMFPRKRSMAGGYWKWSVIGQRLTGDWKMIYKSKKGWWSVCLWVVPLLAAMIGAVVLIIGAIMSPALESVRVPPTIVGVGIIAISAFLLWCYLSASSEITAEELVVRFGPFRWRYRLSSIAEAIPTRVPLGPGLNLVTSWDMVYIRFRGPSGRAVGWPLAISPTNKTEFLRELAGRVPALAGRGERAQEDATRLEP